MGRIRTPWTPGNTGDSGAFALAIDFSSDLAGVATGIWWWQPPNGVVTDVTGILYDQVTEAVLATGTLLAASVVRPAWNLVSFVTPYAFAGDGTVYTATANIGGEQGSENPSTYPWVDATGHVTATQGRFEAGTGYPSSTWVGMHGVDVEFDFTASVDLVPATLTLSGQPLDPEELPAEVDLVPATLTLSGQPVTPAVGLDVDLVPAVLTLVPQSVDPVEFAEVDLVPAVLTLVAQEVEPEGSVTPVVDTYQFGPCEPWTPIWGCDGPPVSGALLDASVAMASEVLYHLTAQRFGTCRVTLRPCRRSCYGGVWPYRDWWEYGTYPTPVLYAGTWYNITCGSCGDSCSCTPVYETVLPGPVASVVEVKVDGVALVNGTDYRVDDYRKLVRLGGSDWPFCQDMNLADTEVGTWSATVDYGEPVPVSGQLAVGELAGEIHKYLCGEDCALPRGVVDISRQGVSMTLARISDLFNTGFIDLPLSDLFIKIANPNHAKARSFVYDLDGPTYRAVGT